MNKYEKRKQALEHDKCEECGGIGECDDAGLGDISYNTWTCPGCNGTGLKKRKHVSKSTTD